MHPRYQEQGFARVDRIFDIPRLLLICNAGALDRFSSSPFSVQRWSYRWTVNWTVGRLIKRRAGFNDSAGELKFKGLATMDFSSERLVGTVIAKRVYIYFLKKATS